MGRDLNSAINIEKEGGVPMVHRELTPADTLASTLLEYFQKIPDVRASMVVETGSPVFDRGEAHRSSVVGSSLLHSIPLIEYRVDILPPEGREILASLTLFMVSHPSEFSIWAVPKAAPEIELALSPDSLCCTHRYSPRCIRVRMRST